MKFNLSSIISILSHAVLYTATALLVIVAISISIIRWHPNLSDIVEQRIATSLADILNADIVIESLDVSRHKLLSEIIAENVKIIDRNNKDNVWQLDKAKIAINLSKSLFTQSLRVKEVSLQGMDLSILRDESGDLRINQKFLLPKNTMTAARSGSTVNQYTDVRLALLDTNLQWVDQLSQTDYLFENIDISIDPTEDGYDVFLSGDLPDQLGKSMRAYMQFAGDVKQLAEAKIKFYLVTEDFHLSEVAKRFVGDSGAKVPVVLDSEVWGLYSKQTLTSLRGFIKAEKIVENPSQINQKLCLSDEYMQQLSMQFEWENIDRNWELLANNIEVITSKRDWPKSDMQFKLHRHTMNAKSIFAHIGNINLGTICNTLHAYSPHIVRFEDQLKDYRINANIDDLFIRFDLSDNHQSSYQYSAQFSDASVWMAQGDRLISGVSGFVDGGDAGGKALLDSTQVGVSVPEQFPGFDMKFTTQGEFVWTHYDNQHEINTNSLKIYNDDLSMNARIHTKIVGADVYTDSQIYLDYANASTVGNYFPLVERTERTKKWLSNAIHKGDVTNATMLLRGNLRDFPFHKSSGVFQTIVNVENGILEYKKDWPILENVQSTVSIDKDFINITSNNATTLNSKIKRVDINIESFLRSILKLNGTVDGPAQDLIEYLGEANLVNKTNSILDQISLQGDSRLEVDFSRSLSRKVDYPPRVSGNIHFLGNTLDIYKVGIELNELAGEVAFNDEGANSESISASVYGQPVSIALSPAGQGASTLVFNGDFDLTEYLTARHPRFKSFFAGSTNVDGELHLPSFFNKENPDKLKLKINSDLIGIHSKLPAPLNKDKENAMQATMLFDQSQHSMSWHLPELIDLHFSLKPQQPFAIKLIDLGATESIDIKSLADDEMTIIGSWEELAPELWLAVYKQFAQPADSQESTTIAPTIDVEIKSLLSSRWPAHDVQLLAQMQNDEYVIDLNSSLGKGIINIPKDKNQAILFNMDSLAVMKPAADSIDKENKPKVAEKKPKLDIDPRNLRPFKFSTDSLIFNDIKLSDVSVNALINDTGMVFSEIKLAAQDMTANGTGTWTIENGDQNTSFDLQLESIDVEDTITDLGFNSSLKKGKASANGNISWSAAPHQFDLSKMYGYAYLKIKDGSVAEIDPGNAGRLLALLNLGAISRRLSLDFKDVTNKGFTFDSIKGELVLDKGGELKTDNVEIKASAADIDINGKTNLVDQTYDQTIFVTPAVTSTLPAAGAIVGGPVGAAAGILADRVAAVVGLNKVSKIEYKMTGTWQEPVIETLSKKKADPATQTQGQRSPP